MLNSSGAASAWVGIDGEACQNAMLQAGVDFTITDGKVSYDGEKHTAQSLDFHHLLIEQLGTSGTPIPPAISRTSLSPLVTLSRPPSPLISRLPEKQLLRT